MSNFFKKVGKGLGYTLGVVVVLSLITIIIASTVKLLVIMF